VSSPSGTTRFVYDGAHDVVETDGSGNALRAFVWGPGADEPLVWWEGTGPKMLHADERGSIVALSDGTGAATAIYKYDEYGVPMSGQTGRFQYTGQMRLNEAGIYNYKARNLLAEAPTFLEPDPTGYAAGMNRYTMGGNR
jgi:RHS repeat-associated protein